MLRLLTFFRTLPLAMYGFVRTAFDMRFGRWDQGLGGFSISASAMRHIHFAHGVCVVDVTLVLHGTDPPLTTHIPSRLGFRLRP